MIYIDVVYITKWSLRFYMWRYMTQNIFIIIGSVMFYCKFLGQPSAELCLIKTYDPLLLTWINFDSSIEK